MRTLVIGVGNRDRGDDAIGPAVVARVKAHGLSTVTVDDPASLVDVWAGAEHVVVVDAVTSGREAGSVQVVDVTCSPLPVRRRAAAGTHALGLATVVELARALGALPPRLVVVGVEAEQVEHGAPLSEPVRDAVDPAVRAVLAAVAAAEESPVGS